MRCFSCKREINRGTEATKMVCDYQQPDGTVLTFGFGQNTSGPMSAATGRLLRAYHFKHYQVMVKREARGGDAVTGRGMGNDLPTAYNVGDLVKNKDDLEREGLTREEAESQTTRKFSDRVHQLREDAMKSGSGSEDQKIKERQRAEAEGGPYKHTHVGTVERHRIMAHLEYAHGFTEFEEKPTYEKATHKHNELHAQMRLSSKTKEREDDPGYSEPKETDWRSQDVHEVGEVPAVDDPSLR